MTPLYTVIPGLDLTAAQRKAVCAMIHSTERTIKELAFYFDNAGNYLGIYKDL
jgi:hypothetical protein